MKTTTIIGLLVLSVLLAACASQAPQVVPAAQSAPEQAPVAAEQPPAAEPATPASAETAPPASLPTSAAATVDVDIKGFAFNPAVITVHKGDTVRWTNKDSAPHTATADDGSFQTNALQQGQSGQVTFDTAGTFTYHCAIHPMMKAKVIVQ